MNIWMLDEVLPVARQANIGSPTEGLGTIMEVYGSLESVSLVTLAPELAGSLDAIQSLSSQGILVSMGHSMGTIEDGLNGRQAGARLVTHLFNAMPPFHHRDPGLVGLLGVDEHLRPCYSIIADGLHCHPAAAKIAYHAHPTGAVLVTDAMPAMGLGEGTHTLGEMVVDVRGIRATITGTGQYALAWDQKHAAPPIIPFTHCHCLALW